MKARQHLLAQVVVVIQRTTAPAYSVVAVSRDRTGLQRRNRFSHPHRFKTPWLKNLSAPAADSAAIVFSFTTVIINSAVIIADLTHQVKSIQHIFIHYILLSLKEQLLRFASCPMQDSNRSISQLIMKNLKLTPQVTFRLGGYNDMTRELWVIGENDNSVPKDTAILMKIERPSENCQFKIKNAGLKSGSREICSPTKL